MLPYIAYMDPMGYGIFTSKDRGIELFFILEDHGRSSDGACRVGKQWVRDHEECVDWICPKILRLLAGGWLIDWCASYPTRNNQVPCHKFWCASQCWYRRHHCCESPPKWCFSRKSTLWYRVTHTSCGVWACSSQNYNPFKINILIPYMTNNIQ